MSMSEYAQALRELEKYPHSNPMPALDRIVFDHPSHWVENAECICS